MNILEKQVLKLVRERGFSIEEAVNIAWDQQKEKGFITKGKLNHRGNEYGKLSSEAREKVRRRIEKGAKRDDFTFYKGIAIYIPDITDAA